MTPSTSEAARPGDLTVELDHVVQSASVPAAPADRLEGRDQLREWRRAWLRAARTASAYRNLRPMTDRRILTHIAFKYANPVEGCFASQGRLAAELGLSREAVNRSLGRLVAAGFLILGHDGRRMRGAGTMGGQTTNVYLLNPGLLSAERTITPSDHTAPAHAPITPSITPEGTLESSVEKGSQEPVNHKRARETRTAGLALTGGPLEDRSPSRPTRPEHDYEAVVTDVAPAAGVPELAPAELAARWAADPEAQALTAREIASALKREAGVGLGGSR